MNKILEALGSRLRPGQVVSASFYSKELKLDWNYSAYLPASYDEADAEQRFPVIYLLHGAYGSHTNFLQKFPTEEMMDDLIAQGRMPEAVVVFVDGFNAFYVDGPAMKMESAVLHDLIPYMESRYHGLGTKAGRVIGGISMGGFGAARFCLKYPEMFSCAVMLSPAVWHEIEPGKCSCAGWGLFREYLSERWASVHPEAYLESYAEANSPVRFFVAHGTRDAAVPIGDAELFVSRLRPYATIDYLAAGGEEHSWPFWKAGMRTGLEYAGAVLKENLKENLNL